MSPVVFSPVFFHRRFVPSPLAGEGWGEGADMASVAFMRWDDVRRHVR